MGSQAAAWTNFSLRMATPGYALPSTFSALCCCLAARLTDLVLKPRICLELDTYVAPLLSTGERLRVSSAAHLVVHIWWWTLVIANARESFGKWQSFPAGVFLDADLQLHSVLGATSGGRTGTSEGWLAIPVQEEESTEVPVIQGCACSTGNRCTAAQLHS